jgi:hypothetical protein
MLRAALEGGDTRESLEWLGNALASLAELACGITGYRADGELCPHVRDMARSLSIWRKALLEDSPSSRAARLHYLMHVRLPTRTPWPLPRPIHWRAGLESHHRRLQHRP